MSVPTETPAIIAAPSTDPTESSIIAVSFRDPPAELKLRPFATVDLPAPLNDPSYTPPVAALDGGGAAVFDNDAKQIVVIGPSQTRKVPMLFDVGPVLVTGGRDTVYGIVQQPTPDNAAGGAIVAIPLTGDRAGAVVASKPLGLVPYTEVASPILGQGRSGIIDRNSGNQLLGYADSDGAARAGVDPPNYALGADGAVRTTDGAIPWTLAIERDPTYPGSYVVDPPPAQIGSGRAVYWTAIGTALDSASGDIPQPTMPVIAVLEADGAGIWYRIPDGWSVVASDEFGVIFARRDGGTIQLASLASAISATQQTRPLPDSGPASDLGHDTDRCSLLCMAR